MKNFGERRPGFIAWSLLLIFATAFALRSIALDWKPPHFDEGINGNFVHQVWQDGFYRYDPKNFHGPLYFYILLVAEVLFGKSVVAYRFATGLISLGALALVVKHRRFLGTSAVWAALMLAVSTGMVFYSRYAIHETLFIFFQILFSYGYFLWIEEKSRRAMTFLIASVVGMIAVKETFFIFVGTWFIAVTAVRIMDRVLKRRPVAEQETVDDAEAPRSFWREAASANDWMIGVSAGAWCLFLLFTGFFLNPPGFQDMFAAFSFWSKTGTGPSGHEKPFFYWLQLLKLYEWPALIGLCTALPFAWFGGFRVRVVALTAFGTWLAYSLIPYKTPWLILNLLWPLAFVFGFAMSFASQRRMLHRVAIVVAFVTLGVTTATMIRLCFQDYTNEREPYVYVQSTRQMKVAIDTISARLEKHPEDLTMRILVLVKDPWPLPWIFGGFPSLVYGRPADVDLNGAGVVLIDGNAQEDLESRLKGKYWRLPFKIRDSYESGFVYFDFDRFVGLVPPETPVLEGAGR